MMLRTRFALGALLALALVAPVRAADAANGLKMGTPDIKSAGALAFSPEGILFIGDAAGAAIFAIDTEDRTPSPAGPFKVQGVDEKIAALLGTEPKQLLFNDLAVNPASGKAYLSIARGKGPDSTAAVVRVDREGKVTEQPLKDVKFAKATLPNAPDPKKMGRGNQPLRLQSITCLGYTNGRVFVAGLSTEEFASTLRAIPFPFTPADKGTGVEIYHGSHGRFETASPVRTFAPFTINGEQHLLAAYTCTPLVKLPVAALKPGEKVKGVTVAELGNMNVPLDMIVYQKEGKDYILMANTARGVMKISAENIDKIEPITQRIGTTAGLKYETLSNLKGVLHLDQLDKEQALLLVKSDSGVNLESIALP
jgi:hypothetical protein